MNPSELESKVLQMLDGELPGEEVAALEAELLESSDARETHRTLARVHSALEMRHASRAVIANTRLVPVERIMARQRKRILEIALAAAAAIAIVSLVVLSMIRVPDPPVASFRTSSGSAFTLTHEGDDGKAPDGNRLAVGSRMQLESGSMEATFGSGVRVVIEGACDLRFLKDDRVVLSHGVGWFEVPSNAVGFAVETEELIVVDLGTSFGVVASSTGHDEIHVTQGAVEVTALEGDGEKETLVAGEARRGNGLGQLDEIAPEVDKFVTKLFQTRSIEMTTDWVSIFDPEANEPRFVGGSAATDSPVTTDAHRDSIAANFSPVTLATGEFITLRGTVTLDVVLPGNVFRIGLFDGATVAQDVSNPYIGIYSEAPTRNDLNFKYGSGADPTHLFSNGTLISSAAVAGGDVAANTPIDFSLTITRVGANLDIATRYTNNGNYHPSGIAEDVEILRIAPGFNYTFNTAAFLMGGLIGGDQAKFSNITVTTGSIPEPADP